MGEDTQEVKLIIDPDDGQTLPISGEVNVTEDENKTLSTNIATALQDTLSSSLSGLSPTDYSEQITTITQSLDSLNTNMSTVGETMGGVSTGITTLNAAVAGIQIPDYYSEELANIASNTKTIGDNTEIIAENTKSYLTDENLFFRECALRLFANSEFEYNSKKVKLIIFDCIDRAEQFTNQVFSAKRKYVKKT